MLATHTLPAPHLFMIADKSMPEVPSKKWAQVLRARRVALGYRSQELLALETQIGKPPKAKDTLSQRTISAIETGDQNPTAMTAARLNTYLKALNWTPQQFTEATGLEFPGVILYPPAGTTQPGGGTPTVTIERPGDRLKKLRENKDLTPEHAAELTGGVLSARRLHNLEEREGAWQKVAEDEATALARAYGMSVISFLNTVNGTPYPAKPNIYTDQVVLENPNLRYGTNLVPEYSMVGMGPGGKDGEILGYIDVPESWAGDHVGYRVFGDSMSPKIEEGDTVVVKVQSYASPKNIIVCWIPEEGMVCKYLREITDDGLHVLTSYNPAHPPIWTRELRIYGLVREVRSRVEIINGNH